MIRLSERSLQPELMDDPALDRKEHQRALRGLARAHTATGTAARFWKRITALDTGSTNRELTVLDVGCGDGVLLRRLHTRAQRSGTSMRLIGCDFSEQALAFARQAASDEQAAIDFHCLDILQDPLPETDVLICSLFLHHFSEPQVVDILRKFAAAARRLVIIEDLKRSNFGYCLCWIGVHLLSRSHVVHTDGPLSVRAAFTAGELRDLLNTAGMRDAVIDRHWPERLLVSWTPASQDGE